MNDVLQSIEAASIKRQQFFSEYKDEEQNFDLKLKETKKLDDEKYNQPVISYEELLRLGSNLHERYDNIDFDVINKYNYGSLDFSINFRQNGIKVNDPYEHVKSCLLMLENKSLGEQYEQYDKYVQNFDHNNNDNENEFKSLLPGQLLQCDFYHIIDTFKKLGFVVTHFEEDLSQFKNRYLSSLFESGANPFQFWCKKNDWCFKVHWFDDCDCKGGLLIVRDVFNTGTERKSPNQYYVDLFCQNTSIERRLNFESLINNKNVEEKYEMYLKLPEYLEDEKSSNFKIISENIKLNDELILHDNYSIHVKNDLGQCWIMIDKYSKHKDLIIVGSKDFDMNYNQKKSDIISGTIKENKQPNNNKNEESIFEKKPNNNNYYYVDVYGYRFLEYKGKESIPELIRCINCFIKQHNEPPHPFETQIIEYLKQQTLIEKKYILKVNKDMKNYYKNLVINIIIKIRLRYDLFGYNNKDVLEKLTIKKKEIKPIYYTINITSNGNESELVLKETPPNDDDFFTKQKPNEILTLNGSNEKLFEDFKNLINGLNQKYY